MRWLVVVLLVLGCEKSKPAPKNDFEAFEAFEAKYVEYYAFLEKMAKSEGKKIDKKDRVTSYGFVYVGKSGVYIDRKLVATLAEIDTKRDAIVAAIAANSTIDPDYGPTSTVTFDVDDEPASVAAKALRWFAGRKTWVLRKWEDPEVPVRIYRELCMASLRDKPTVADEETPLLSVLMLDTDIWVGLSRVNEFYQIPNYNNERDFEKLDNVLRDNKRSAFFADRTDIEIAAPSGTAREVLVAIDVACKNGFNDVAILERAQLSANPTL